MPLSGNRRWGRADTIRACQLWRPRARLETLRFQEQLAAEPRRWERMLGFLECCVSRSDWCRGLPIHWQIGKDHDMARREHGDVPFQRSDDDGKKRMR